MSVAESPEPRGVDDYQGENHQGERHRRQYLAEIGEHWLELERHHLEESKQVGAHRNPHRVPTAEDDDGQRNPTEVAGQIVTPTGDLIE